MSMASSLIVFATQKRKRKKKRKEKGKKAKEKELKEKKKRKSKKDKKGDEIAECGFEFDLISRVFHLLLRSK